MFNNYKDDDNALMNGSRSMNWLIPLHKHNIRKHCFQGLFPWVGKTFIILIMTNINYIIWITRKTCDELQSLEVYDRDNCVLYEYWKFHIILLFWNPVEILVIFLFGLFKKKSFASVFENPDYCCEQRGEGSSSGSGMYIERTCIALNTRLLNK